MKKIIWFILVVVLLAAVAAGLWFRAKLAPVDAARYLPVDTAVFAAMPDFLESMRRWETTPLARIGAEPEVAAFLEMPLKQLGLSANPSEAISHLGQVKPISCFAAAPRVADGQLEVVFGFRFLGGRRNLEAGLDRMREALAGTMAPAVVEIEHRGYTLTVQEVPGAEIVSGIRGDWGLLSTSRDAVADFFDRLRGRDTTPALSENPEFHSVLAQLPEESDLVLYARMDAVLEGAVELGRRFGAEPIPAQFEALRAIEAMGFGSRMGADGFREALFLQSAAMPLTGGRGGKTLAFAPRDTLVFLNTHSNANMLAGASLTDFLPDAINTDLRRADLDLREAAAWFGREAALVLDWPPDNPQPGGVAAFEVTEPDKVEAMIRRLLALFAGGYTEMRVDGRTALAAPTAAPGILEPVFTCTEEFLLLASGPSVLETSLHAEDAGLAESEAFAGLKPVMEQSDIAFAYIALDRIFGTAYDRLRPVLIFSAALMPGAFEFMDVSKLPETESVVRHLEPVWFSKRTVENGYLMETGGPVTFNQLVALGIGIWLQFQNNSADDD